MRLFLLQTLVFTVLIGSVWDSPAQASEPPENNPTTRYGLEWTDDFAWERVLSIAEVEGPSIDERLKRAQEQLVKQGGGVIFFPAGTYYFREHIRLQPGIVIRGTNPVNTEKFNPVVPEDKPKPFMDAREPRYALGTCFVFPEYNPTFRRKGTPVSTAFKGIRTADPQNADYCGVVNVDILNGHIALGTKETLKENYRAGRMKGHHLVYGNILRNTAVPREDIPRDFQHDWQRFPDVEYGAITVYACEDVLIANNRIPEYDEANFRMRDYQMYPSKEMMQKNEGLTGRTVWFDYQNRTGIRVNYLPMLPKLKIWKIYEELEQAVQDGTYEKYITPGTLAKGIVIRENYVFSTGHGGIKTTGDGAYVAFNEVFCKPGVVLATATGLYMGSHVNDVRAIEVRGWRWTIEGNNFRVYSNYTPAGIKYNDGEGLMHESWQNTGIRDSKMINNTGNRYFCFWRVPVRGLTIRGNHINIERGWHAIFVNSQSRFSPDDLRDLPCEDVTIENNLTEGSGIKVLGTNGDKNVIRNNRHAVKNQARIENFAGARVKGNTNYELAQGKEE